MKKILASILILFMILSYAACGRTSEKDGMKAIYVIIKGAGNAYWAVLQAGAQQAAEDFGCQVIIQGILDEVSIDAQTAMLQDAVEASADAIIFAPADAQAQANAVSEIYQSGIPIVLVDTLIDGTEDYSASIVTDNVQAGKDAAAELIRRLGLRVAENEDAEIAIQRGAMGNKAIDDRLEGFKEYWDAKAPAGWVVLWDEVFDNQGKEELYMQAGQNFMSDHPNLKAFFSPNNGSTVGFAATLKEMNRTDITLVGFDFSPEIAGLIINPEYNVSTMLQRQYFMGYDGVRIALEIANGGQMAFLELSPGIMQPENRKDVLISAMIVDSSNVTSDVVKATVGPDYEKTMESIEA